MTLTAMTFVGAALAGGPSGAEIGISADVPIQPSSKKPTWSMSQGKSQARDTDKHPDLLVPIGYNADKLNWWGRYYDEDGNVYRGREAMAIVRASGCAVEHLDNYQRNLMLANVCYISSIPLNLTVVGLPCGLGCMGVGSYFMFKAGKDFELGLREFNARGDEEG